MGVKLHPALDVAAIPEEKLQGLGVLFDIDQVIYKVVQRTGLLLVSRTSMRQEGLMRLPAWCDS